MARPQKSGLDYFALDVNMSDEVELIEAEYGLIGFAILIKLFQKIYSEGYYYEWTEKEQILFSNRVSTDRNIVTSVVSDCVKWDIFNQEMYEKYNILTSRRIQNHYIAATYKRVNVEIVEEYLLIDVSDRTNLDLIRVSDIRNEHTTIVTDDKSTQSKVKESKVNNITTTIIRDQQGEIEKNNSVAPVGAVPTKQNDPVADMDADSIQQDNDLVASVDADSTKQDSPLKVIEEYYLHEVRKRLTCSSNDMKDMVEAYETYKDMDFILSVLKSATQDNIARNGKCKINSFSYFLPILSDEWERRTKAKEVVRVEPNRTGLKKSSKYDLSGFLWKGEEAN